MLINMKKLLLSLALITGFGLVANAQTQDAVRKLSIGAEFGISTTDFSKDRIKVGGSLLYEHPIAASFSLTGSVGYLSNTLKGDTRTEYKASGWPTNFGIVPVKFGGKYYFARHFYAAAEVGAAFETSQVGGVGFLYGVGIGSSFSVSKKSSLDIGLRYESWSYKPGTDRFIGLRVAYSFGL